MNLYPVKDAKDNIDVLIRQKHIDTCVPADPDRCALVLAALDWNGNGRRIEYFSVHRYIAYGRFTGEKTDYRWQIPAATRRFLEDVDKGACPKFPGAGLLLHFRAPRKTIRLRHFKSKKFKELRNQSSEKSSRKKVKRQYRLPDQKTFAGVRSRFGRRTSERK